MFIFMPETVSHWFEFFNGQLNLRNNNNSFLKKRLRLSQQSDLFKIHTASGQHNTLWGKRYPLSSTCMCSQMPTIAQCHCDWQGKACAILPLQRPWPCAPLVSSHDLPLIGQILRLSLCSMHDCMYESISNARSRLAHRLTHISYAHVRNYKQHPLDDTSNLNFKVFMNLDVQKTGTQINHLAYVHMQLNTVYIKCKHNLRD